MEKDFKIDLVYTWVNGNDLKWQTEKDEWLTRLDIPLSNATNNCRYIDNQELKFSLRSVEMNAPWINKIFIVTNGQVPEWLDTTHPKIQIVTHKEIMPADALPTFNSEAIETCIANISGLSEHFLYANDDTFINRPVTPDFFFDKKGNPIIRMSKQNWDDETINRVLYCKNIIYSRDLIKKTYKKDYLYIPSHNIEPYRKSYYLECKNKFAKEFYETCYKRFRAENSIQRTIHNFYVLATKNIKVVKLDKNLFCYPLENINILKAKIRRNNPILLCINDCESTLNENRIALKSLLVNLFYKSAPWEKQKVFQIEPIFTSSKAKTIVFAPDNNYCKYFSVALQALIENSKNYEDYDIIVFENDITERNKNILLKMLPPNFSLRFFDISGFINERLGDIQLKSREYWSVSMYYRIFIPMIMQKYKKVLYCDADVVTTDSLRELFEIDFEGNEILAVIDTVSPVISSYPQRAKQMKEYLTLKNPKNYFNSGIIMFNIPDINLELYKEKLHKALTVELLLFPDQDILNILFEGKTKLISCKWNYQYGVSIFNPNYENIIYGEYKKDFLEARKNPKIIHYTSSCKPWHSPTKEKADEFWSYARKSPFYEEILFTQLEPPEVKSKTWKIYYNYYRTKLLSFVTLGKQRKHYQEKRNNLKQQVRKIRNSVHL